MVNHAHNHDKSGFIRQKIMVRHCPSVMHTILVLHAQSFTHSVVSPRQAQRHCPSCTYSYLNQLWKMVLLHAIIEMHSQLTVLYNSILFCSRHFLHKNRCKSCLVEWGQKRFFYLEKPWRYLDIKGCTSRIPSWKWLKIYNLRVRTLYSPRYLGDSTFL
jgi:hypothetical protein